MTEGNKTMVAPVAADVVTADIDWHTGEIEDIDGLGNERCITTKWWLVTKVWKIERT